MQVKIVRETMNRSLDLWKGVPGVCEEFLAPSPYPSSSTGKFFCYYFSLGDLLYCKPHDALKLII